VERLLGFGLPACRPAASTTPLVQLTAIAVARLICSTAAAISGPLKADSACCISFCESFVHRSNLFAVIGSGGIMDDACLPSDKQALGDARQRPPDSCAYTAQPAPLQNEYNPSDRIRGGLRRASTASTCSTLCSHIVTCATRSRLGTAFEFALGMVPAF
jgi:hypothetical protein